MAVDDLLLPERFFDFTAHPFEHHTLFTRPGVRTVVDVLNEIGPYCHEMFAAFPRTYDTEYLVEHSDWPSTICEGIFNVILSPGASCTPDRIVGGEEEHFLFIDENAQVRGGVFDLSSKPLPAFPTDLERHTPKGAALAALEPC